MQDLTDRALLSIGKVAKEPNIVLEIEGVGVVYGAQIIKKVAHIGDPGLVIGDPANDPNAFYIGGLINKSNQANKVTMDGTTTSIQQTLDIDKGQGGSIQTMAIALMDGDGSITELITPGNVLDDILQARCRVYFGANDLAFPEDYVVIFRGVVTDVTSDAGKIVLQLNHPDDRKLGSIFTQVQTNLSNDITNVQTSIQLDSVDDLLLPITGPDGTIDESFESCILIDNEIIQYTSIVGTTLNGCTRHKFGTTAAAHTANSGVTSFYRLTGNCILLGLKILASGVNGNYLEDVQATNVNDIESSVIANTLFFKNTDLIQKYNVQIGDFVTTTGFSNGANNVALKVILDIEQVGEGSYITLDDVTFVTELATDGLVSFRSQFDTLPDGLGLTNDEIDIDEHLRLYQMFLSNFDYDFYIKDTIAPARDFIETEIYAPVACFSLPRKARASVGYHIGPIPGLEVKTFDHTNIKDPSKVKIKRTTSRQFYNEVVYKFDESALTENFLSGIIIISEDSKAQIRGTNKTFTVTSKGLRTVNGGSNIANSQGNRRLNRYKFAAEVITFGCLFADGFATEIGDIITVDGSQLLLPDIRTGLKGMAPRFFEVTNKGFNFKTGDIQIEAIDTNFTGHGRYGLMSPSSKIDSGISTTQFVIKASFSERFGVAEYKKWKNFPQCSVRIRSADFVTSADTKIISATSNTITVSPALPWTPSADMIMELTHYDNADTTDKIKKYYGFMKDTDFADGGPQYVML